MGQKVNPYGFRLGVIRQSKSRWFAEGKTYREHLVEDLKIRQFVEGALKAASLSNITIERTSDTLTVTVETAKPGIVIGRQGKDVDRRVVAAVRCGGSVKALLAGRGDLAFGQAVDLVVVQQPSHVHVAAHGCDCVVPAFGEPVAVAAFGDHDQP